MKVVWKPYGPWKAERVLRVKRLVFLYSQI